MSKARPTQSQMKLLMELMAKDPQLCSSKFTQTFTHKIAKQKWENISIHLNSLPGAQKSWDKWKKTWQDTRTSTKSKAAAIKRHIAGTGGGPSCAIELNDIEKNTLSLMSQTAVSGCVESTESIVEFEFGEAPDTEIVTLGTNEFDMEESMLNPDSHNNIKFSNENEQSANIAPKPIFNKNDQIPNVAPKPNLKRKTTVAVKLGESNKAATRLGDIAERKCDIKENYYQKKIKFIEEQTSLLKNINTLLTTLVSDKLL